MSDTLWVQRPRPHLGSPVDAVLRGAPTTLAELRALRMQLRAGLTNGARPAGADDDDVDRLLLAFEELVSNGLRHGGGPVSVAVTTAGPGWLLEVTDAAGDAPPVPAVDRDAALGGLGLYLVAQISGAHGWTAGDDGRKVVWARWTSPGRQPRRPSRSERRLRRRSGGHSRRRFGGRPRPRQEGRGPVRSRPVPARVQRPGRGTARGAGPPHAGSASPSLPWSC
jgi:anti-sigma regulatory factor (Ser/Thr protein kinase)